MTTTTRSSSSLHKTLRASCLIVAILVTCLTLLEQTQYTAVLKGYLRDEEAEWTWPTSITTTTAAVVVDSCASSSSTNHNTTSSSLVQTSLDELQNKSNSLQESIAQLQDTLMNLEASLSIRLSQTPKQNHAITPPPKASSKIVVSQSQTLHTIWNQLVADTPRGQSGQKRLIHFKPRRNPQPRDVVLVTHGSLYKLSVFRTELQAWQGPASLALYIDEVDPKLDRFDLLEQYLEAFSKEFQDTSIHLFLEYHNLPKRPSGVYPHNILRNMAMDFAESDYVLTLDVDFIPGPHNTYASLKQSLLDTPLTTNSNRTAADWMRQEKALLVLPAFEVKKKQGKSQATPDLISRNKTELLASTRRNETEWFRINYYSRGHKPSNYPKWFAGAKTTTTAAAAARDNPVFYPISYKWGYEPYVLAYRHGLPRYWEDFRGYGLNKISWIMECQRSGYRFGVLWDYWVTHLEHESANKASHNTNKKKASTFYQYLDERYPQNNMTTTANTTGSGENRTKEERRRRR